MFKWELINDDTGERLILNKEGEYIDPHGWEDIALEHNRSERYDGIFLDFSRDLSFHCQGGGKEILDAIYKEKGSEGNATLKCYFSCEGNFKLLFEGFVNFASYKEEFRGKTLHTTVEVRKKGITQTVMSRDETDVDLLSEVSIGGVQLNPYLHAPYEFNSHSKTVRLVSKYNDAPDGITPGCVGLSFSGLTSIFNNPGLALVSADLDKTNEVQDRWNTSYLGMEERINTSGQPYAYPITVQVNWNFTGRWRASFVSADDLAAPCAGSTPEIVNIDMLSDFRLKLFKSRLTPESSNLTQFDADFLTGWTLASIPEQNFVASNINEPFSSSGGITITLDDSNEKIYLLWGMGIQVTVSGEVGGSLWFEYDTAEIEFISDTNSPPTVFKTVAIHEAWSRICESITDKTLAFKSEFFGRKNSQGLKYNQNGYGAFTAITDGLRIRGFEKSTSAILTDGETKKGIITNQKDMYDACNAVWGIGLGIEKHEGTEVVRVEEKHYFYQNVEIIKISNIPNLEMQFAEDMAYSEVQLGYEKWRTESKGGLDEPLTIARWIFPKIKNIKNVKELTSPFVGAMYAIESTRRSAIQFNTTGDTDYDDDIFFIATSRTRPDVVPSTELTIAEKNENIWVDPNTLLAPDTAYNLRFNLFSNFDRTMNQFTNNLTKDTPQQINYSYLEGNGQMTFAYIETSYDQAGNLNKLGSNNVQNTELPNGRHQRQYPLVVPEIYTFTYAIPFSDYLDILDNPYGYISFSPTEQKYKKGYIKTLSYNISRQMAEFTLIRKYD